MATTVDNTTIDALAATVPAPFGPLTRVDDVGLAPSPNSGVRLDFTTALGGTVLLSYDELRNPDLVQDRVNQSDPWTHQVSKIITDSDGLDALITSVGSAPYTYEDYQSLVEFLRTHFSQALGTIF